MNILHIITGLQKAAGTSTFCGEVCNQLAALGHDVTVAICNPNQPNLYPLNPRVNLVSIESVLNTNHQSLTPNRYSLIHIHGLWSLILHKVSCWARSCQIPVVWSTHGMTAPWALKHKFWKKCLPWYLYQKCDLKRAALIHCTSDFEVEWNNDLGFKRTFLAPLGTFLPEENNNGRVERRERGEGEVGVENRSGVEGESRSKVASNWYDVADPDVIGAMQPIRIILSDAVLCDRRAIKDVFKSFGLVENAFDGRKVSFPSKSVGKMLGQRGIDLYRVAGSFAELFRVSRRAWSETEAEIGNHKEHRNIGAYHQYIAKFNDGENECFIRFTVREERGGKNARNEVHSSTVSRITVYKAKGVKLSNLGHAQAEDSTPFVDNKIAYYISRVNGAGEKCLNVGIGECLNKAGRFHSPTQTLNSNSNHKTLLFVGRIYPVKALDRLIEAFALATRTNHQPLTTNRWTLRLVGPDQAGHMAELLSLCDRLGLSYSRPDGSCSTPYSLHPTPSPRPQVEFAGPKFGLDLDSEYANCDALALVSHTENFGATVADAMAHSKPVIASTKTPWKIVSGRGCGFWVDNDVETLSAALLQLFNLSAIQLSEMGVNGRKLAEERYSWAAVAKTLGEEYERTRQ